MLAKLAPARAFRLKMPNQISTWLSQLAEVGVKWKVTFGCAANQSSFFLWVERLSRITWISRSGGCSAGETDPFRERGPAVRIPSLRQRACLSISVPFLQR